MSRGGVDPRPSTPVSVVLYVHNGMPYLERALEAILGQSHREFELCIVDDGSTDGTADVLDRAASYDSRIIVQHQQPRGRTRLHETFNAGVAMARHELIAVANADDVWRSDKLERQVAEFERDPQLDICHHEATFIDADGKVLFGGFRRYVSPYPSAPPRPWRFVEGNPIPNPTVVFHRGILRRIGLQEVGEMHDHQFWFKATLAGCRFLGLPDRLIRYRLHEGSHSTAASRRSVIEEEHRHCAANMVRRHGIDQMVPELGVLDDDDIENRAWANSFIAAHLWADGSFDLAEELWREALRLSDNLAIVCGLGMAALRLGRESNALRMLRAAADGGVGQARSLLDDAHHLDEMTPPTWQGEPPTIAALVAHTDVEGLPPVVDPRPDRFDHVVVIDAQVDVGGLSKVMCGAAKDGAERPRRMLVLAAGTADINIITDAYHQAEAVMLDLGARLHIEVDVAPADQRMSIAAAHRLEGVEVWAGASQTDSLVPG